MVSHGILHIEMLTRILLRVNKKDPGGPINLETDLVTARELAAQLRVALSTVRAWSRLTDIPCHRVGRLVRFVVAEVLAWCREGGSLAKGHRTKAEREGRAA